MTLRYLSLFSGIGGFDLANTCVTGHGIEDDVALAHKGHCYFFELIMPYGVSLAVSYCQIVRRVIELVQVNVMNDLAARQGPAAFIGGDDDVFGNIARLVRVGMIGVKDVIVTVAKLNLVPSGLLGFRNQNTTALPVVVKYPDLISFGRLTSGNPHLPHGTPDDFLSSAVLGRDLILGHFESYVIPEKLFFREWNAVSVFVRHTGIISYAGKSVETGGDAQ